MKNVILIIISLFAANCLSACNNGGQRENMNTVNKENELPGYSADPDAGRAYNYTAPKWINVADLKVPPAPGTYSAHSTQMAGD